MNDRPRFDVRERYLKQPERDLLANPMAAPVTALVDRLLLELWRYDRALQSLTPGGSEFVAEPENCAAFARSMMNARRVRTP